MSLTIPEDWFVNPNVLGEFYKKYRDKPIEEIRKVSFEQGIALGRQVKEQLGIGGTGLDAISSVLKMVLRDEPTARVTYLDGDGVLLRNTGFCPLMTACISMNLPWTWLCSALGWPFFHGLASAVNQKVDLIMEKRREKGDPCCDHIFRIGLGKLILP